MTFMALRTVEKKSKNPILRAVSEPVGKVDKTLKKLIQDMRDTMFDLKGVGIAAPQVGVNLRLALARLNVETPHEVVVTLINPEIDDLSSEMTELEEGCLSLPRQWGKVKRHQALTVRFQDEKGRKQSLLLHDFNARVIQHEVDHLNGMLFIDRAEIHP